MLYLFLQPHRQGVVLLSGDPAGYLSCVHEGMELQRQRTLCAACLARQRLWRGGVRRHVPEDAEVTFFAALVESMGVGVAVADQRVALGDERCALGSGAAMSAASVQYAACTPSISLSGIARDPLRSSGVATFVCCALSVSQRTSAHPSVRRQTF